MSPYNENRVFVSYSHDSPEHCERVRELVEQLRRDSVDCHFDLYEQNPDEPWPLWMERQVREAQHVLVVCTETYWRRSSGLEAPGTGLGAVFESHLVRIELFERGGRNGKFVPVVWDLEDRKFIPPPLQGYTYYSPTNPAGYDKLLRFLLEQPAYRPQPLGSRPNLEPAPPARSPFVPAAGPGPTPQPARQAKPIALKPSPSSLLGAWLTLEALSPRALSTEDDAQNPFRQRVTLDGRSVPWASPTTKAQAPPSKAGKASEEKAYWILYLGEIDLGFAARRLLARYPDPHADERSSLSGNCPLAAIALDEHGTPLPERVAIASFGWSFGQLLKADGAALHGFPQAEKEMRAELTRQLAEAGSAPLDAARIQALSEWVIERTALAGEGVKTQSTALRVVQRGRQASEPPDLEMFNSFFLEDLTRVAEACEKGAVGPALRAFLQGEPRLSPRRDILAEEEAEALRYCVQPGYLPPARWPAPYSLNLLQQAAVTLLRLELRPDGIVGVNGPPGTGKTTLLRDLIADVVCERARVLVEYDRPEEAFQERGVVEVANTQLRIFEVTPGLRGHEIVVASSNNRAVENITAELPAREALSNLEEDLHYWSSLASAIATDRNGSTKAKCWGLVSAVLGSAANTKAFIEAFWWRREGGLAGYLRDLQDSWARGTPSSEPKGAYERDTYPPPSRAEAERRWQEARATWRELAQVVEVRIQALAGAAEPTAKRSGLREQDAGYWKRPHAELLRDSPWVNARLQQSRADLFAASFRVHRAFQDLVATQLRHNLGLLFTTLQGRLPLGTYEPLLGSLWSTLFLVVPVLSTTFASFARLFGKLGPEALGWLLIDEAGQALPQAAVGAIWRSRRVVALGDPLQIEPVSTLPPPLVRAMCREQGVDELCWAGPIASVQTLADRASWLGSHVRGGDGDTWMGFPLRVHRRCADPMFSICNQIAYGGSMVQDTPERPSPIGEILGDSAWFPISGPSEGKWVPAEGEAAAGLLRRCLRSQPGKAPDLFFITPFRGVAQNLGRALLPELEGLFPSQEEREAWVKEQVGTIHTFQGREAEAVVLVLGAGGPGQEAARGWASRRPNLLNVAVSRARARLYVLGNLDAWSRAGTFRTLAKYLPVA